MTKLQIKLIISVEVGILIRRSCLARILKKENYMKITKIGDTKTVMSNPQSVHNYFGWPTVARLQNGKIAVAASGNRLSHVCPFGKAVISYSEDEGESYTFPAPVIDTVLDDRDGGIATFGEKGVIVTSFNNTAAFQRSVLDMRECIPDEKLNAYAGAYIDSIDPEEEKRVLGATFKISHDCGVTFGKLNKSPITSPHGPCELSDGTLLWVGTIFESKEGGKNENNIKAYSINTSNGEMKYVGEIENININGIVPLSCEPYAVQLPDGKIIAHIRVQSGHNNEEYGCFTIYQSESTDFGKSWTKPVQILSDFGGAPSHLALTSGGAVICTYGFRAHAPYGVKAAISYDGGKSWDKDHYIYENHVGYDLGYPSTVELSDGSFLTVFYAVTEKGGPATILQQKWKIE